MRILLVGPPFEKGTADIHSGGMGGYTRKMQLYLQNFKSEYFKQVPCFLTLKGQPFRFGLAGRFARELTLFLRLLLSERPAGIHLLGQYRKAIYREFIFAFIAYVLRIPYLYEIKAGIFINWYKLASGPNRAMMRFILKKAKTVLAQGRPYVDFLYEEFGIEAVFFPNFIASTELREFVKRELIPSPLRIMFIGYAIEAKGIYELVQACRDLTDSFPVQLTTVGAEHPEFKSWADNLPAKNGFLWLRKGRLPHQKVWKALQENDIYCYPTRYRGEGHNNTINEAMNSGLVTITTKAGFLESIIGKDRGYLLERGTAAEITHLIRMILDNKEEAVRRTQNARRYLEERLLDTVAFEKLENAYFKMALGEKILSA